MPSADEKPTKTAVIEHDVHAAVSLLASVEDDATIQGFINSTLRDHDRVQKYREAVEERDRLLEKHDDLSVREAEMRALERIS